MSLPAPVSAVLGSENLARTTVICPGFAFTVSFSPASSFLYPLRHRVLALGVEHPGGDRPEHPELLRLLGGPPNTWTIQVQVAGGTMITALEHLPRGTTLLRAQHAR